jgi:hypothetical protein
MARRSEKPATHLGERVTAKTSGPVKQFWLIDPWGWGPAVIAGVLAILLAVVYHFVSQARGGFLLSLDEGYIHTVLAYNLSETGVLGLNPGQEGGGSSSPVWTFLLTVLTWIGVRPDIAAIFLSVVSLGLAVTFTVRYAFAMLKPKAAWAVAAMVVFTGQHAATALTGLEAMLIAAFVILAFYFHGQGWSKRSIAAFVAGSLIRPEVVFAAFTAWIADVYNAVTGRHRFKNAWRAMEKPSERFVQVVVVFLAGLAVISMLSGTAPSALAGRRWMYGLGSQMFTWQGDAQLTYFNYLSSLATRLQFAIGPGGTLGTIWALAIGALLIVGLIRLLLGDKSTGRATAMYMILTPLFMGVLIGHEGHMGRYMAPFWMLMPMVVVMGWNYLVSKLPKDSSMSLAVVIMVGALLVGGFIPQLFHWANWHADTVDHLRKVHLKMAYTVYERVPEDESVAGFDIGLLTYRSKRHVVDLRGLTDREMAKAVVQGHTPELLKQRGVKYVVLPETPYESTRYYLVRRLGFDPGELRQMKVVALPKEERPYLKATQVALTQLTLYRLR